MTKHIDSNTKYTGTVRRYGMTLLALVMASALLLSGCAPMNAPQNIPQPEQSTAVPENSGSGEEPSVQTQTGDAQSDEAAADKVPAAGSAPAGEGPAQGRLSEEDVIAIVLSRVPGATADEVVALELDTDDGMPEYEGTLLHDGLEYEFEIDAVNGNILEWEIDD